MRPDFIEERLIDGRDPVDAASQDFDWPRLYERFGEGESDADIDKWRCVICADRLRRERQNIRRLKRA